MRARGCALVAIVWLLILGQLSLAQDRWGAISGWVDDPSGASVAGASVEVKHLATGARQLVRTGALKAFLVSHLGPGNYRVTVEKNGFMRVSAPAVAVTVDRQTVLRLRLQLGVLNETVEVTAVAVQVEASASVLSASVGQGAIGRLPVNGRDVYRLATLAGWAAEVPAQSRYHNNGYAIAISHGGARLSQAGFRLDGIAMGQGGEVGPGSIHGLVLGVDAIEEFSLLGGAFDARYGPALGGMVNAVTRSGGNRLRGSLTYVHRNDNVDARNFFDLEKPEFRRHQYSLALGGPLRREKAFYFVNYEGLRQLQGFTVTDTTLSPAARRGELASGRVDVDPAIAPLLELYPLPNGAVLGDTGFYVYQDRQQGRQDFGTVRLDLANSPVSRYFARYRGDSASRLGRTEFNLGSIRNATRHHSAAVEHARALSATSLVVGRLGAVRSVSQFGMTEVAHPLTRNAGFFFHPGATALGLIDVEGLTLLPGGSNSLQYGLYAFNSYQATADLTRFGGRRNSAGGIALERGHFNSVPPTRVNGEYRFTSIRHFLTNVPSRFRAMLPGSDPTRGFRQWLGAAYWQESYQPSRWLTLSVGLRHEWATVPYEVNGKQSNLDRLTDLELSVGRSLFENPSGRNVLPRVGLAVGLARIGNTVARAGYGVYPELLTSRYLVLAGLRNPPFFLVGSTSGSQPGHFPARGYRTFLARPNPELRVERLERKPRQPHVHQWNLSLERHAGRNLTVRLAYLGARGANLSSIVNDANLATPVTLPEGRLYFPEGSSRLNPRFHQIRDRKFDAESFYHAGNLSLVMRGVASGLDASYTFGKSIDDSSNYIGTGEAANAVMLPINGPSRFNRGLSGHDVRHRLVISAFRKLPGPRRGAWKSILGGWDAAFLASYSSGLPLTVRLAYDAARTLTSTPDRQSGQRPDLAPGGRIRITGDPARWVDPAAFMRPQDGFLGNLGRNTVPGPLSASVDVALATAARLAGGGEGCVVKFRAEIFNLFNRVNFDLPSAERTELFTRTGVREDFARITSAGAPRQLQLMLRVRF